MTEDSTTEAVESQGGNESEEDSPVIKQLRSQLKEAQRELSRTPSRSDIEAEVRASLARDNAIQRELVALNLPAGLSETVEGKLGEAEVSREAVIEALTAIGFSLSDEKDGEAEGANQAAEQLAGVANLSASVANAATGQTQDNLTDKINAATTPEELASIMREAGLGS